jgi:hypothetical protein
MKGKSKDQTIKAIQRLGNKVTAADVVAKTGLALDEANQQLASIAADTAATLQVNTNGEIIYCFRSNFSYIYLSKGLARVISLCGGRLLNFLVLIFKISFGLVLVISMIFVFGLILIIRSIASVCTEQAESILPMWSEFFHAIVSFLRFDWKNLQRGSEASTSVDGEDNRGFLFDCYLFLFGPGNPNEHIQQERWKLIAQAIRLNEGVIVAEHLTPYTGLSPDNEQVVFAVLAKFGGYPAVSDSGEIIYIFPLLSVRSEVESYAHTEPLLQEHEWMFSGLSGRALTSVVMLAAANILGATFFVFLFNFLGAAHAKQLNLFNFVVAYGCSFLIVPFVRFCAISCKNKSIRERNELAAAYEQMLGNPTGELLRKLEDAERMRRTTTIQQSKQIVYSTDRDYLEQIMDT